MSPEVAALARHRLNSAREALRDSDYLQERGAYKSAINRSITPNFMPHGRFSPPANSIQPGTVAFQFDQCERVLEQLL